MRLKPIKVLIPQEDGSYIDWGRNASVNGVRGEGPAKLYTGEAAEVIKALLKYSKKRKSNGRRTK